MDDMDKKWTIWTIDFYRPYSPLILRLSKPIMHDSKQCSNRPKLKIWSIDKKIYAK